MNLLEWAVLYMSKLITVQVTVNEGTLQGDVVLNPYGSPYFSFKGIPYAEPPVGDLRFQAPVPKKPWDGIRSAKEHGPICYQNAAFSNFSGPIGSEDCLYLNVYTPSIAPTNLLPVMVWIHGGAFISGSGNDDTYSPEFLIRKEVVLVTFNYRLEILGFLSLGTEDIPGNAAMKDQVAAMRWVKENIKKFGGDPDNITIFGESAGGASVAYQLVSPMSKGLFNRAISQSGTLACWWAYTINPRDTALALAKELGCYSNDDKEVSDCLKSQPAEKLIAKKMKITYGESVRLVKSVDFSIVSEMQFGDNEIFFNGNPYEVLRDGIHEGVEIINGYTQDEGVIFFMTENRTEKIFTEANKFIDFFVPEPYTINSTVPTQIEIGRKFREHYIHDRIASKDTLDDLLQYFTMELFQYGSISMQKMIAKTNKNKNYLYKFTCTSELNYFTEMAGLGDLFDYRPTVAHADDLAYLFPTNLSEDIDMQSTPFKMIEQVTTLWTNFAKYGDPTPNDNLGIKWLPYTIENQDYLDIGEKLVPGTSPDKEDVELWETSFAEFLPALAP